MPHRMTYFLHFIQNAAISALVFFLGILPHSTEAGLFGIFGEATKNKEIPAEYNSQTLPLLAAAYNIDPNPSKGGGDIALADNSALISSAGPAGSLANLPNAPVHKQTDIYIVREGDTLSGIAQMFDVSVNTIRWANDLKKTDVIKPGQELLILPVSGVQYTVKRGGTLRDIVKQYSKGKNFKEILAEAAEFNDLDPDKWLEKGTTVIIPDAEPQIQESGTPWRDKRKYSRRVIASKAYKNAPSYSGYFIRPIAGGVKTQGLHGYNAVDIAVPLGTPVKASASGRVIRAKYSGWNYGYGRYILILHPNGTKTLYAHLSEVLVTQGQTVKQGQLIGKTGNSGRSTGPHIHFEIRGARNPF